MDIPREDQIAFAKEILPIVDSTRDAVALEHLHNVAAMVLKWAGFEDNGVAFDLSEYTFELTEIAKGKEDTGWKDEARTSLEKQLSTTD